MNCIGKGVLAAIWLVCAPLIAPAARLEAIWIGPDGNGGEGDWNTPSNWNLGVVPNNGVDADGDGVPDIFDVRIDSLPAAVSFVHSDAPPAEIAGLQIDEGDTLELTQPPPFTLRDLDAHVEVVNNGLIRVGGGRGHTPLLTFGGNTLRLSGNGTIELGLATGAHGRLAALDGGRVINGTGHTLQSLGPLEAGHIAGYVPNVTTANAALTNEGTIVARDGAVFSILLNQETHFNEGMIRTANRADLVLYSTGGRLWNTGSITALDGADFELQGSSFVNDSGGVVRADNGSRVEFRLAPDQQFVNRGLMEANGAQSYISIAGRPVAHEGMGTIRAAAGGIVVLEHGTFHPDPAIQIADSQSILTIGQGAVFENEGNVLSGGLGRLSFNGGGLNPPLVRGGEITSGAGSLILGHPRLDDVTLSGTATGIGNGIDVKGVITVDSIFTVADHFSIGLSRGDAILRGPGVSRFQFHTSFDPEGHTLEIAAGHRVETGGLYMGPGTVLVNGDLQAGHMTVDGVLGGDGTVGADVRVGFSFPGAISPGSGIGTLTVDGNVEFSGSGSFLAELGRNDSDLLRMSGDLRLSFEEELRLTGGVAGQSYLIAEYGGERYGVFDRVTPGYDVIYDDVNKRVYVGPVPEPASVALAVVGIIAAMSWRWRNWRRCAKSSGG